ncbi:MAG: DUF1501 domain-containing protein [Planctomycetota bacterium]
MTTRYCPGPSRRRFLQLGSMAVTGSGLTALPGQACRLGQDSDPAVIFLWLPGGPPHQDTYDMKPNAPIEYRGLFNPIKTTVPGLDICELFPMQAKRAHRFSLIRSISHRFSDHGGGHKKFMTGRDPLSPVGFVNDYPAVGSMISKVIGDATPGMPSYVVQTDGGRTGIDTFSLGSAYLGPSTHPFTVGGDPSTPGFQVRNLEKRQGSNLKLRERLELLDSISSPTPVLNRQSGPEAFRAKALDLVSNSTARVAFDLGNEPEKVREAYGWHAYGQRALMARRLVEAGARFVTMVLESPNVVGKSWPKGVLYNWDSHAVNGHIFDDARWRFPLLDQAVSALIDDLYDRGLDKRVLLVVTGEFGRTPKVEHSVGSQTKVMQPGRDHWPQAMSVLVSGGGLKMGQVVGSTTSKAETPKDRPLVPNDLWATVMRHLDIPYRDINFLDHSGRPMPMLPDGEPIRELI